MLKATVVYDEEDKGRRIVISEIKIMTLIAKKGSFHNGYIELKGEEGKNDYDDYSEEINYRGCLEHLGIKTKKVFIGFDTAHPYNTERPESQTKESVLIMCKELIDELDSLT